jgi:hypothetical protein
MWRPLSKQMSLFQVHTLLGKKQSKQIDCGWAGVFQKEIMPLIPENEFASLYCQDDGRPNFPVALLVGMSLIKETRNLTVELLIRAFHFDLEVMGALGLGPGEYTVSERTYYNFRSKLVGSPAAMATFERLTDAMILALGLDTGRQRLDSTQVCSNMARLTRLDLFVRTIEGFVTAFAKAFAGRIGALPQRLRERYLERSGGYFADTTGRKSRGRLEAAARDVAWLVSRFQEDKEVGALASFGLLRRLFEEQCEVVHAPGADPVGVTVPAEEVASTSLQNPSDPDATYSAHKGQGYQVQLAETCADGNPIQMITHLEVRGAHESDHSALTPYLDAVEARGVNPEEVLADTAYNSGENFVEALDRGVDLVAPIGGTKDIDDLGLLDFEVDWDTCRVMRCPEGHAPIRQRPTGKGNGMNVRFDKATCAACDLREDCPAGRNKARLRLTQANLAVAHCRFREKTAEFKESYKDRSGIERTNSELKTRHAMRRLRSRGKGWVTLDVIFKVLACNVKRFCQHRVEQRLREAAELERALAAASWLRDRWFTEFHRVIASALPASRHAYADNFSGHGRELRAPAVLRHAA